MILFIVIKQYKDYMNLEIEENIFDDLGECIKLSNISEDNSNNTQQVLLQRLINSITII